MASAASVYIGEWVAGVKQGYGIMDDIMTGWLNHRVQLFCHRYTFILFIYFYLGEKYLGLWNNNMKQGNGLIVTLDGVYYEGNFVHNVLTVKRSFQEKCFLVFLNYYILYIFYVKGPWHNDIGRWNALRR